jgi:hypothetical protein
MLNNCFNFNKFNTMSILFNLKLKILRKQEKLEESSKKPG